MKVLIVEDDSASAMYLKELLDHHADCDMVEDGEEAVQAFQYAREKNSPYDLILMDIMMPNLDGQAALDQIRQIEKEKYNIHLDGVKVVMTTALDDQVNILKAFCKGGATNYLVKPITKQKLFALLGELNLLS